MTNDNPMADFRLRSFLEVVRHGQFSAAAEALGLTQPAVSQHIASLEETYGLPLLVRSGRKTVPTAGGQVLYENAQRIESVYLRIAREMKSVHASARSYSVGATLTVAEYLLPPLIGAYQHAREHVKIRLAVQNTSATIELVNRSRVALGIVEGPFDEGSLRFSKLRMDELVAVCAPTHPMVERVGGRRIPLKRLLAEDLILREPGSGTRDVFEGHLAAAGIDPRTLHPFMEIGSNNAIKSLVISEVGISVISELAVAEDLRSGRLVRIPVAGARIRRDIRAVWNEYSDAAFVEDFRGFLAARLSAGPLQDGLGAPAGSSPH